MKKFVTLTMVVILLLGVFTFNVSAQNNMSVYIDGAKVEFDVQPQAINGRTMLPIRAIFEKMGATVDWDGSTNSAICTKGDTVVKMTVNSMDMYINNELTKMDISPVVIDGRTLAPARYVAEAFGADVQWSQKNNSVVICSKDVYAYADYPDIPDLGRCYNLPVFSETVEDEFKVFSYVYSDMSNEDYYSYLYDNSAMILGNYVELPADTSNGITTITYTKSGEIMPRYFICASYAEDGSMIFVVMIPIEEPIETVENKVTLYALDGRTIDVLESEVVAHLNVGWYRTLAETQQTLYALDGRTITVYKAEVPAYKNVGWYETLAETQQTMYAPDGRTIVVYKAEVPAYKNVGWYETYEAAQAANKPSYSNNNYYNDTSNYEPNYNNQPNSGGSSVYRTPSGKRYHFDPDCGGKNSYETTLQQAKSAGLTPCSKCAQ